MKAAIFRKHGGPEVIEIADVQRPEPAAGEALIAVKAAAMNHLDLWTRRGLPGLDFDLPHIGGSDIAGIVEEIGEGVEGLEPSTRVLVNPSLCCGECEWCLKGEADQREAGSTSQSSMRDVDGKCSARQALSPDASQPPDIGSAQTSTRFREM